MSNLDLARGRSTVLTLTNQIGSQANPGDVVVIDTANNESFTTSVSSNTATGVLGIVDEVIGAASNGRVVVEGYARNVKALATAAKGDYLYHSTTARTAAHMAGTTPAPGAFGYVLKGGAGINPSAVIFSPVQAGSSLSLGSNSTDVAPTSGLGAATTYSPSTHFHRGITQIAVSSNTLTGSIALVAQGSVGITTSGQNIQISVAGSGGSSGSSTGGILAVGIYNPGTVQVASVSGTSLADVDATNLKVTFTAPASGNVVIDMDASGSVDTGASLGDRVFWSLRESTTNLTMPICVATYVGASSTADLRRFHATIYLTGVSAGSHTYKWAAAVSAGTHTIRSGGSATSDLAGPSVLVVSAAP